ncbi:MAG: tRNA uridine-5-carboxymethylaminomethyl(34) synthesis GTPase MnmE [Lachnospiraceae bacterium]|nr:tRNA uridine-5-carboxymethylaminomethyl(34) synthesis GTPase MnmE [Lachnospiraceae bacterium]
MSKTIAAISTPLGSGGIGVIRVSGDDAFCICDRIFKSLNGKLLSDMKGYTAAFGKVYDDANVLDEVVAVVFRTPHSYTGENVVELSCHGGVYITSQVLRAVLNAGAVPAEAGEFTKRAFLNGKINLAESEAIMDIISSKGRAAAKSALNIKEGRLRKEIDVIKSYLVNSAAHLSAWADYPEEDIPEVSEETLLNNIDSALLSLEKLIKGYDVGKVIKEGIDTLIIGKPNVGKSTLMNFLSGCEKSIVTDIPGTTRDIIQETVTLGNVVLLLSDTAGLRETDNPIEKIGVDRAKQRVESCGLVLAVFDGSKQIDKDDTDMLELIKNQPAVAIINKADIDNIIDVNYIKKYVKSVVNISAAKGLGLEELIAAVEKIAGTAEFDENATIISNERQRNCVVKSLDSLKEAKIALESGMTLDAVTVSIEDAIQSILELTGERASEVVVHGVFSKFCVGK